MGGQTTLLDALGQVNGHSVKERAEGLANLKHVLRYNQHNPGIEDLGDPTFHTIYETLFEITVTEKSAWLKAKTSTTRSAAESRLANVSSTLRLAVEVGVRSIKLKTVKALLDHVVQTLPLTNGSLCTPLALDYAKCLHTIANYQPHVEHLPQRDWERTASSCLVLLQSTAAEVADDEAVSGVGMSSTAGTADGLSYRSSRSNVKASAGSQGMRSLIRQVAEELISTVSLLTVAPNAPIGTIASSLLWALIEFLKSGSVAGHSQQEAFAAVNHVLAWASIEETNLTRKVTSHLIRLIRHFWSQKLTALKDEMLMTLLYLRPYISQLMRQAEALTLRSELSGLYDTLRTEYTKRLDRDLLNLDDLRLELHRTRPNGGHSVHKTIFALRCTGARAEASWTLVDMLATLCSILSDGVQDHTSSDEDGDEKISHRPRKRQRLSNDYEDALSTTGKGSTSSRICALQTIAFLAQQKLLSVKQIAKGVDLLSTSCSEEHSGAAAWAFIGVASYASQASASDASLTSRWATVWQLASRTLSNVTTCRAACHLLSILINRDIVAQTSMSELLQTLTGSMDLSGPSVLADSVLDLLQLTLHSAQQLNPGTSHLLAETLLGWLFQMFTPSKFEDKTYAATHHLYEPADVRVLMSACLGHEIHSIRSPPLAVWESVAQTWVACEQQYDLLSYLLLLPKVECPFSPHLLREHIRTNRMAPIARVSCEAIALNHMTAELHKTRNAWEQWSQERIRGVSLDMFKSLCQAICVMCCVAHCSSFHDARRQMQAQKQLTDLLAALSTFVVSSNCGQDKVDSMLSTFSRNFTGMQDNRPEHFAPSKCERIMCRYVNNVLSIRFQTADINGQDDDEDTVAAGNAWDSQDSRRGKATLAAPEFKTDLAVASSPLALRSIVDLYTTLITAMDDEQTATGGRVATASAVVVDHILSLPEANILSGRTILATMPQMGLLLSAQDANRLMEYCTERILSSYLYERSEVAIGAILDLMSSLMPLWTEHDNRSLQGLGLDMYEWYMQALKAKVLSANVQKRLATLLLELCEVDADYPRENNVPSVRTSLFQLLALGSIDMLYYLAGRIPRIFRLFVLSLHEDIFVDLQSNLPDDSEQIEGMAIRLLFLAKLASAWHSLLRPCIYYIFENAGRVKSSAPYAARCVEELTQALNFRSSQTLFQLFAPQLLYTWLEGNSLNGLPYAAFQYASLDELLEQNQVEIAAQLLMRGKEDSMHVITSVLKISGKDLAKRAFAKTLAYAMGWDCSNRSPDSPEATSEARLRNLVGKDEYKALTRQCFPAIMGHFYLSTQQEDAQDRWLENMQPQQRKEDYSAANQALSEIKGYGFSTRTLPPSQQPSFKPRYLPDQIERLCRRTGTDPLNRWDFSGFALAARMLLDAIDDTLGPLHRCLMLRKLRTLICMAGEVALSRLPLEMLVGAIIPFISDSECADDALGVLQYLLQRGQAYLKQESVAFAHGTVLVLVLRIQEHSMARQDSTTQESQYRQTVQRMEGFRAWLVKYLQQCQRSGGTQHQASSTALIKALTSVQLPGNANKNSPESSLLLLMLQQQRKAQPLLPHSHCVEGLRLLTKGFEAPSSVKEDCLGSDSLSSEYADSLWLFLNSTVVDDGLMVWASIVLGRAYLSTGVRPHFTGRPTAPELGQVADAQEGVARSRSKIAQRLADLMQSPNREEAGLADWTLRNAIYDFVDAAEALAFEQMLPGTLLPAVAGGTCGYKPPLATVTKTGLTGRESIRDALHVAITTTDEAWTRTLAISLCQWAAKISILPALPALLQNVPGLAKELLPSIIHIILFVERDSEQVLRAELSQSLSEHLTDESSLLRSRQQFMLEVLLYLRSQPLPGEATQADRMLWLEVDLIPTSFAAARCGMPTAALMLAESATTTALPTRRTSSRASLAPSLPAHIPEDLLVSIFKDLQEPDSFYGVQQPPTLSAVLERLDYERDGLRSLMFRSAQMDSLMRSSHRSSPSDSAGLMYSLSALRLHSLEYALVSGPMATTTPNQAEMVDAARKLQQWDIASPDATGEGAATSFKAFQELSRTSDRAQMASRLRALIVDLVQPVLQSTGTASPSTSWCNALASLTEIGESLESSTEALVRSCWQTMQKREEWMRMARFEDCNAIVSCRSTLFSVLAQNSNLLKGMHVGVKAIKTVEADALLHVSRVARNQGVLQEALSAATQATHLAAQAKTIGLEVSAAAANETALVLWKVGEASTSVRMLRDVLKAGDCESHDIPVGEAGLLAEVAYQLDNARLEKPDEILESYLKPAIKHLRGRNEGHEAGKVFYRYAVFCDQQLQAPGDQEEMNRIVTLRETRREKIAELQSISKNMKKSADDRRDASILASKASQWYKIDDAEYQRLKLNRDTFIQQSLHHYLCALQASDEHDICVLRFFALWLENAEEPSANKAVSVDLKTVPSWKFAVLNNQLMSRLEKDDTTFQRSLKALVQRVCADHPHHSLHHLYVATRKPMRRDDAASQSRYEAAGIIRSVLQSEKQTGEFVKRVFAANGEYKYFAESPSDGLNARTVVAQFPPALKVTQKIVSMRVPPATFSPALRPDGEYSDIPTVVRWAAHMSVMGGLSHPKVLTAYASNGVMYKQLFKHNDELRQDAIMEQVFGEVSKMLRNHKAARQRNLQVRTYKVIPLTPRCGIIEWVPNSTPIGDYLRPAHLRYYPKSLKSVKASDMIKAVQASTIEARVNEFRKVCELMPPVMRHFFFERFVDPDEWFQKRTAYTRTTATVSILGWVVGLGDRHCQNILLDEQSGEAVHIDLGVAFEAGRVLPIPENVPFRLSRDIVDGMGATKTEGVFRRCCEFTMDALREDKNSIMTLLDVLRYDPLHSWTISPNRAKRMQDAQETGRAGGGGGGGDGEEGSSKRKEQEVGEADRALGVVEKKLSSTLSTAATVNELIQQATDEKNLATLFSGWSAYF